MAGVLAGRMDSVLLFRTPTKVEFTNVVWNTHASFFLLLLLLFCWPFLHVFVFRIVPDFAKVKRWTTREMNGYIYLWYHAENKEPYWEPEEIKEITKGSWVYRGRSEHYVRAHIQVSELAAKTLMTPTKLLSDTCGFLNLKTWKTDEVFTHISHFQEIPENGADVAHLAQVHEANILAGSDLRHLIGHLWNTAVHKWEASWKAGEEPNSHIAHIKINHYIKVFGKYQLFSMDVSIRQVEITNI